MLEFILAMMNLFFQVMCFLRDLCIDSMRTYLNVFHGIVNVIKSIKCDDVEDFASACIVVILWIEAIRIVLRLVKQNPRMKIWTWFDRKIKQENNHLNANSKAYDYQYCTCKKSGKRRGRYVKRLQNTISEKDLVE
ncbi:hypothetical protein M0804_004241 [Polistes exclamans]|nr:hypothetical protein M0804_004241 [Polistes exclamans]